jgi:hypothetical protein
MISSTVTVYHDTWALHCINNTYFLFQLLLDFSLFFSPTGPFSTPSNCTHYFLHPHQLSPPPGEPVLSGTNSNTIPSVKGMG